MLNSAEMEIIRAIAALEEDRDFALVVAWFKEMRAELDRTYPKAKDDIELRWIQGRRQIIDAFLDLAVGARERYAKMELQQRKVSNRREVLRDGAHN